eukprot:4059879-Pleurochrysis_carterae.AAC.2
MASMLVYASLPRPGSAQVVRTTPTRDDGAWARSSRARCLLRYLIALIIKAQSSGRLAMLCRRIPWGPGTTFVQDSSKFCLTLHMREAILAGVLRKFIEIFGKSGPYPAIRGPAYLYVRSSLQASKTDGRQLYA